MHNCKFVYCTVYKPCSTPVFINATYVRIRVHKKCKKGRWWDAGEMEYRTSKQHQEIEMEYRTFKQHQEIWNNYSEVWRNPNGYYN